MRASDTSPNEHVGLRGFQVPALRQIVEAKVGDVARVLAQIAVERKVSATERIAEGRSVEGLDFRHGSGAVFRHHGSSVGERDRLGCRKRCQAAAAGAQDEHASDALEMSIHGMTPVPTSNEPSHLEVRRTT